MRVTARAAADRRWSVGLLGAAAYGAGRRRAPPRRAARRVRHRQRVARGTGHLHDVDHDLRRADARPRRRRRPRRAAEPTVDVLGPRRPRRRRCASSSPGSTSWRGSPRPPPARYDAATRAAVRGFQAKRDLEATGVVDQRTWQRLARMTKQPDARPALQRPAPRPGDPRAGRQGRGGPRPAGPAGRDRVALRRRDRAPTTTTTVAAVRGFQAKREIPVTGEVDQRTLDRLHAMTTTPTHEAMYNLGDRSAGALDARCRTGRVLCVDKTSQHAALGRRRQGAEDVRGPLRRLDQRRPARASSPSTQGRATTCRASTARRCRTRCSSPAARRCTTPPTSRPAGTPARRTGA